MIRVTRVIVTAGTKQSVFTEQGETFCGVQALNALKTKWVEPADGEAYNEVYFDKIGFLQRSVKKDSFFRSSRA